MVTQAVSHVSNSGNDFRGKVIVSIRINTITSFLIVEAPWSSLVHRALPTGSEHYQ